MKKKLLVALFAVIMVCLFAFSVNAANEVTLLDGSTADFTTVFKVGTDNGVDNVVKGFNSGYSKDDITDIIFPDEINGIESNFLFGDAKNLNTLTFAATDTFFISGDGIFSKCSVKTITFNPECVVELRKGNFSDCTSLTKITFPKFKKLAGSAFKGCSAMVNTNELIFVEGMTEIGGHAFNGCTSVKGTVYFPSTLETIQEYSFQKTTFGYFDLSKCTSLTKVGGGYGGPFTDNDVITTLDMSACVNLKELKNSFAQSCDNLVEVILPPNLETIPHKAFAHCYKLQSIVFPASLTYVADEAFHSARGGQTVKTFTVYLQSAVQFHATYPFRDSGAKIEFVLLNGVTVEQFKAVNTYSAITNAVTVDYLDPENCWAYTTGQTISNHTIVVNYCESLALTKSHSQTDAICDNSDYCKDCNYLVLEPHVGKMTVSYPNGYDAVGLKQSCHLQNCNGNAVVELEPIFKSLGYSVKENNGYGILVTYMINIEALEEYETANGELEIGVIMANANFDGQTEFMSKGADGKYELNSTRGIKVEISGKAYSKISVKIDNFTQNEATLDLVMALYVADADGISYIQHKGTYAGTVTKGDATLDVVNITKIAEIVNVVLPFVVPAQASGIKEN